MKLNTHVFQNNLFTKPSLTAVKVDSASPPAVPTRSDSVAASFSRDFMAPATKGWYGNASQTAVNGIRGTATGPQGAGLGGVLLLNNIANLPGKYRDAIKAAQSGDFNAAVQKGSIAGRGTLSTVKGGLELGATLSEAQKFKGVAAAAADAVQLAGGTAGVAQDIAAKAAAAAFAGKELRQVDVLAELAKSSGKVAWVGNTVKMAGADALRGFGLGTAAASLEKGVAAAGQKVAAAGGEALLKSLGGAKVVDTAVDVAKMADTAVDVAKVVDTAMDVGKVAASAAGLATKGAGTLAKAAGRFAPGANVAFAALDTALAVSTLMDPKASIAAKVTSGVTALGSVVAATNIPIVSQVGAAVSLGSTAAGVVADKFGGAISDGAKAAGGAIAGGAKAVGSAIADGARKIFKGW